MFAPKEYFYVCRDRAKLSYLERGLLTPVKNFWHSIAVITNIISLKKFLPEIILAHFSQYLHLIYPPPAKIQVSS